MSKSISDTNNISFRSLFISSLLILSIPVFFSRSVLYWTSGFVNYVIGSVMFMFYYIYCNPIIEGSKINRNFFWSIITLILGFLSVLCVENLTILCDVFALFIIIYSAVRLKKVHISNFTYLAGSVAGNILMFSNNTYGAIFSKFDDDPDGFRHIEMSFRGERTKIRKILPGCYLCFCSLLFLCFLY